ncbi:hypothetical protein KAR91_29495, partial [Candidatus Pacearchaeota archaeon]|nr:hypothetical protein [Candidatus Pacearchaeota archaeon]
MLKKHNTSSDREGNIKEMSRDKTGQIKREAENSPFEALVTTYYPKSQTIDVNRPTRFGQTVSETVVVYGDFFQATGMIKSPKIAATFDDDGFSTIRNPEQKLPTSDKYVLDNNIVALVFRTDFGYATSSFRFLTADSPMLNNVKPGRKITRHDDGSFYIQDEDGNSQFKHPSGLNIRIGDSDDDIELDEDFPPHEKNELDYASGVKVYVEYPSGGKIGYENDGLILFSNENGEVKTDVLDPTLDHETNILTIINDFMAKFAVHIHPCIVPTGPPDNAADILPP